MDVSSQVRAEEETRSARLHLQAVTDSMTEGLFSLGPDGGVTLMNRAAETMLGWTLDEVRGQRLHDIIYQHGLGDRNHGGLDCPLGDIARGEAGHSSEVRLVDEDVFARRDGHSLSVSYTVSPLDCVHGSDGRVVVFRDAAQVRAEQERMTEQRRALGWKERIESALARGAFRLYAQPIVDLSTRISSQNELLLRIVEEDGSVSTPQDYLVAAEENGLIGEIDRWVVGRAMDLAAAGHPVEVNVSATSICDRAFLRHVEDLLVTSGADPERLVFEITETAVMADEEAGRQFVDRVHELGCQVALDDFGTGHSGFAYLKQLPVDFVKIDIEFVRDLRRNVASQLVVEAVATLAAGMGMRTVAEGVEDDETLELLVRLGVDFAQGHHLGRPAPF